MLRQFHMASNLPVYSFFMYEPRANASDKGPCQFPTLGFVVSRYYSVKKFVPETFWKIDLSLSRQTSSKEHIETTFNWKRGHLFEFDVALSLYECVLSHPLARVIKVTNKGVKKWYILDHVLST